MSLTPISHLRDEIVALYAETGSYLGTANKLYNRFYPELAQPNQLRAYIRTELTIEGGQDLEVIAENVRLAKAAQRSRDIGRVKDKVIPRARSHRKRRHRVQCSYLAEVK